MKAFVYRCPTTGFRVQGLALDDETSERTGDVYHGVTCLACGLVHFVNPKTGKTAGESGE